MAWLPLQGSRDQVLQIVSFSLLMTARVACYQDDVIIIALLMHTMGGGPIFFFRWFWRKKIITNSYFIFFFMFICDRLCEKGAYGAITKLEI